MDESVIRNNITYIKRKWSIWLCRCVFSFQMIMPYEFLCCVSLWLQNRGGFLQVHRCDVMEVNCGAVRSSSWLKPLRLGAANHGSEVTCQPFGWPEDQSGNGRPAPASPVKYKGLRCRAEPPRRWPAATASQPASLNKHTAGRLQTRWLCSRLHYLTWKSSRSSFISATRCCLMKCTDRGGRRGARFKPSDALALGSAHWYTNALWGAYTVKNTFTFVLVIYST